MLARATAAGLMDKRVTSDQVAARARVAELAAAVPPSQSRQARYMRKRRQSGDRCPDCRYLFTARGHQRRCRNTAPAGPLAITPAPVRLAITPAPVRLAITLAPARLAIAATPVRPAIAFVAVVSCACGCGAVFVPDPRWPERCRFASDSCRKRAHKRARLARVREQREAAARPCGCGCGAAVVAWPDPRKRYASGTCRRRARSGRDRARYERKRARVTELPQHKVLAIMPPAVRLAIEAPPGRECACGCGARFTPGSRPTRRFFSDSCRKRPVHRAERELLRELKAAAAEPDQSAAGVLETELVSKAPPRTVLRPAVITAPRPVVITAPRPVVLVPG